MGTLVPPLFSVPLTCGVSPFAPIGLARQGSGVMVGVTATGEVDTAPGAVAVINAALTTRVPSPPPRPCANSGPHTLPAVTKSRDILMHMQKKVPIMTIKRPLTPRFHRAINVSIIGLLSFPPNFTRATARVALYLAPVCFLLEVSRCAA